MKIRPHQTDFTRLCVVCEPAERRKYLQENPALPKKKRYGRESSIECNTCKKTLCVWPCFFVYHNNRDYVQAYLRTKYATEPEA